MSKPPVSVDLDPADAIAVGHTIDSLVQLGRVPEFARERVERVGKQLLAAGRRHAKEHG